MSFFIDSVYSTLNLISRVSRCSNSTVLVYRRANEVWLIPVCVCVSLRQLLKTELGSFFSEYLQNQLLTKGMVILRDKIRFYEGT